MTTKIILDDADGQCDVREKIQLGLETVAEVAIQLHDSDVNALAYAILAGVRDCADTWDRIMSAFIDWQRAVARAVDHNHSEELCDNALVYQHQYLSVVGSAVDEVVANTTKQKFPGVGAAATAFDSTTCLIPHTAVQS